MDSMSTGEVARRLGVSLPTVRAAARRLGIEPARTPGGRRRFSPQQLAALTADLGAVPAVSGLTRVEVQVLAAVSRAPRGLRSERAVARAAGVSPTAAGRALHHLVERDLVVERSRVLAEGRAVPAALWQLHVGPAWFEVAGAVGRTVLPAPRPTLAPNRLPRRYWHLFWNQDPAALDLEADGDLIATRMVLADDVGALAWAARYLPADALRAAARARAADPRTRALVRNVASAA